jgi:peptidoglycan/LPS O-acetylase OafA/YrhL
VTASTQIRTNTVRAVKPADPPAIPRTFRPDIQGLRAVAVTLVVLYHAHVPAITGGFVGVDVFFVISGFLITRQLVREVTRTGRVSLVRFYGRRMRRLLPPAAIVVVFALLLARISLPLSSVRSLAHDVYYSAFYGINYHFAAEGVQYGGSTVPPSPLQHFWSLAVEEQFYVVWPLLIIACVVIGRRRGSRTLMLASIVVISAVTLFLSIVITPRNQPMAYFSIHTRAWELGLGALVALTADSWARVPARVAAPVAWIGLVMLFASAFIYDDATPYPGSAAIVPVVGSALVIAAGVNHSAGGVESVLGRAVPQYIGKMSYSWYLWHWPMLILLPAWAGRTFGWGMNLEICALAFWMAVLSYFVENAALRSSWSLRRWVPTGVSISGSTVIVAVVVAITLPTLVGTGFGTTTSLSSDNIAPLQVELTSAVIVKNVPRNLTPTLESAAKDFPEHNGDCFSALTMTRVLTCTFGDPNGTRTAVLYGDSHAQQWLGPLDIDAKKAGVKLILVAKAACPVADLPVHNEDLKREYTECGTWRDAAMSYVKQLKPDIIVSSQSEEVPFTRYSDLRLARATVQTLKDISTATTKVVFIGDTPHPGTDAIACLGKHLTNASACSYPRKKSYIDFPTRHGVVNHAIQQAGIGLIDPLSFFCTVTSCPAVVGNLLVRRDLGHITSSYALHLAPLLAPIFKAAS